MKPIALDFLKNKYALKQEIKLLKIGISTKNNSCLLYWNDAERKIGRLRDTIGF